jgi:hypothetical protein
VKKRKIIGLLTILAGLPGLGGLLLLDRLDSYPSAAVIVVVNAIVIRGICGTFGGILIWRGSKWGYYLSLVTWLYLVAVSILTFTQLYDSGVLLSFDFLKEHYSRFGRPFLLSFLKVFFGLPILYIILNDLLRTHDLKQSS